MNAFDPAATDAADLDAYPEPKCSSCWDSGQIERCHPSTDALIGWDPCTDPECMERAAANLAAWEAEQELRRQEEATRVWDESECPF